MKVLELFQKINYDNFILAYNFLYPHEIYDWLCSRNLRNTFAQIKKVKKSIEYICSTYKIMDYDDEQMATVFINELESEDIEDKKTSFHLIYVNNKVMQQARETGKKIRFCFDGEKSDNIIPIEYKNYGLSRDRDKNNELLNYEVSQKSIDLYGIDICAVVIFKELTIFGYNEEMIKYVEDNIRKKLEKSVHKSTTTYSAEEVFARLEENILKNANDIEKSVIIANREKEKSLKKIQREYQREKIISNMNIVNDFINEP